MVGSAWIFMRDGSVIRGVAAVSSNVWCIGIQIGKGSNSSLLSRRHVPTNNDAFAILEAFERLCCAVTVL